MKITIELLLAFVAAIGTIGGIIAWWLGRILEDRKDSIEQATIIGFLKENLVEIKRDLSEVKRDIQELRSSKGNSGHHHR